MVHCKFCGDCKDKDCPCTFCHKKQYRKSQALERIASRKNRRIKESLGAGETE